MTEITCHARAVLLEFIAYLRWSGVNSGLSRVEMFFTGIALLPALGVGTVHACGRSTLCVTAEEVRLFDDCFARFFLDDRVADATILADPDAVPTLPGSIEMRRRDEEASDDERELHVGATSDVEVLRHKPLSELTDAERTDVMAMIASMRGSVATRPSRRLAKAHRGTVDVARTLRIAFAHAGEPPDLQRARPERRARRRVLLLDVSGSMAAFAPGLLRFGYAAHHCAPARTEVFTIGTRVTRITRHLRAEDPERAMHAVSRAIPDWSGGTRLGDQIGAFLDTWGQRSAARGAIVVIASDGWERGGADRLASQMSRLQALAYRVVWCNPHKSVPGFEPLTRGMQAALPFVDLFVSGRTASEFEDLLRAVSGG